MRQEPTTKHPSHAPNASKPLLPALSNREHPSHVANKRQENPKSPHKRLLAAWESGLDSGHKGSNPFSPAFSNGRTPAM